MYNIGIIGLGYVGSAVLNVFRNENIFSFDINKPCNQSSIENLVEKSQIIFVCVPTPMKSNGECSIDIVENVLKEINLTSKKVEVIIKSTVPPGTCRAFQEKYKNLNIIFSPEFLTEANFNEDFSKQDRIIFSGKSYSKSLNLFQKYFTDVKYIFLSYEEAEMVKYVGNCFLALKVSFANEVFKLCEKMDIEYNNVINVVSIDKRIGSSHFSVPGPDKKMGFGGSCFPKDISAFLALYKDYNVKNYILKAAWERNQKIDRPEKDWIKLKGRAVVE